MSEMTTEEKLAKAVEFIKSIEKLNKNDYDTFNLDDVENAAYVECTCCGNTANFDFNWPRNVSLNTEYIDWKVIDDLSDKAWHVLADIAE